MNILIVDGQGGGVGKALCTELKARRPELKLTCAGTNALATAAMLKAGADQGATGENAVRLLAAQADIIMGPMGIVLADAMLGEITPAMAMYIAQSGAVKILIPVKRCKVIVPGTQDVPIAKAVAMAADEAEQLLP